MAPGPLLSPWCLPLAPSIPSPQRLNAPWAEVEATQKDSPKAALPSPLSLGAGHCPSPNPSPSEHTHSSCIPQERLHLREPQKRGSMPWGDFVFKIGRLHKAEVKASPCPSAGSTCLTDSARVPCSCGLPPSPSPLTHISHTCGTGLFSAFPNPSPRKPQARQAEQTAHG